MTFRAAIFVLATAALAAAADDPIGAGGDLRPGILSGLIATLEDPAILAASPSAWLSKVRWLDPAAPLHSKLLDRWIR